MENPVMTVAQFAQATWDRLFQEKQTGVEVCYSAWMRAQDAQRTNKKQERIGELQAASEERRQAYCQAASDLHTWLRTHPMPAWKRAANQAADEKRDATRWKDEEKALGVALMSILKRPPTSPEFEEARSLFHYSMGQFEDVAQAVAREREAAGQEQSSEVVCCQPVTRYHVERYEDTDDSRKVGPDVLCTDDRHAASLVMNGIFQAGELARIFDRETEEYVYP